MKLLLDQGIPRSAAQLLREVNIDTLHVSEIGMSSAEDPDIIQKAQEEERIIVTLDADFHTLLALNNILVLLLTALQHYDKLYWRLSHKDFF